MKNNIFRNMHDQCVPDKRVSDELMERLEKVNGNSHRRIYPIAAAACIALISVFAAVSVIHDSDVEIALGDGSGSAAEETDVIGEATIIAIHIPEDSTDESGSSVSGEEEYKYQTLPYIQETGFAGENEIIVSEEGDDTYPTYPDIKETAPAVPLDGETSDSGETYIPETAAIATVPEELEDIFAANGWQENVTLGEIFRKYMPDCPVGETVSTRIEYTDNRFGEPLAVMKYVNIDYSVFAGLTDSYLELEASPDIPVSNAAPDIMTVQYKYFSADTPETNSDKDGIIYFNIYNGTGMTVSTSLYDGCIYFPFDSSDLYERIKFTAEQLAGYDPEKYNTPVQIDYSDGSVEEEIISPPSEPIIFPDADDHDSDVSYETDSEGNILE